MNHGYFFTLDIEKSRLDENLAVFNYSDLPAYLGNPHKGTPQYPISIIITNTSVRCILHYCVYKCHTHVEEYPGLETICIDKPYYLHQLPLGHTVVNGAKPTEIFEIEEEIFELPFVNDNSRLTSVVKNLYCTKFPLKRDSTSAKKYDLNYIDYLITSRYSRCGVDDAQDVEKLHKACEKFRNIDCTKQCYSSLKVWGLKEEESKDEEKLYDLETEGKLDKFLRKVLLDFLFDVKHSDVFQNSGNFKTMQEGLEANFFVSAIIKKSEFYYQRNLVNRNKESKNYQIYAEYFDKAEHAWVDCIRDPQAEKHFRYIPDWYQLQEDKKNTVCKVIKNEFDKVCQANYPRFIVRKDSWFTDPEEEMQRIVFALKTDKTIENEKGKCIHEPVCEINNSYEFAKKKGTESDFKDLRIREKQISQWMYKRYDFADALRMAFSPIGKQWAAWVNWIIVLLFLGISFAFLIRPDWVKDHFHLFTYAAVITLLFVSVSFVIKLGRFIFAKGPRANTFHLHLILPRLIASIAAAWMTITFSEDLFKIFFDQHWSWSSILIISVVVLFFVYFEVDKIIPYSTKWTKLCRSSELVLLSFVISLAVGICAINFTGERLIERSGILSDFYMQQLEAEDFDYEDDFVQIGEKVYRFDTLSIDEDYIKGKENYELIPHLSTTVRNEESSSHSIASKVDINIMGIDYPIFILWDFLIQFAFVAMFIGIFIQMIFEEKNITES